MHLNAHCAHPLAQRLLQAGAWQLQAQYRVLIAVAFGKAIAKWIRFIGHQLKICKCNNVTHCLDGKEGCGQQLAC